MAGLYFKHSLHVTPNVAPQTLVQFMAPANQRVRIRRVAIFPLGSTGASAPIEFDLGTQNGAGTSVDDTAALLKASPDAAETVQTSARITFTAEAAATIVRHNLAIHQQGFLVWTPPTPDEAIIEGGERWALRQLTASVVPLLVQFDLEE